MATNTRASKKDQSTTRLLVLSFTRKRQTRQQINNKNTSSDIIIGYETVIILNKTQI